MDPLEKFGKNADLYERMRDEYRQKFFDKLIVWLAMGIIISFVIIFILYKPIIIYW